jgi:hypothetical protein
MRRIFVVLFLIVFIGIFAENASFYGSVADMGMGLQNGIANLNHLSANSFSNPAKLGYLNGLSYSYCSVLGEKLDLGYYLKSDFSNTNIAIGNSGLGIISSMPSKKGWGNEIIWKEMTNAQTDNFNIISNYFLFSINKFIFQRDICQTILSHFPFWLFGSEPCHGICFGNFHCLECGILRSR